MTNVGQLRSENEDSLLICGSSRHFVSGVSDCRKSWLQSTPILACIADGMGGHAAGALASQLVCKSLDTYSARILGARDNNEIANAIRQAVIHANQVIAAAEKNSSELRGLGSTLVGLCITESGITCFHSGDSRIYGLKSGFLQQISIDHNQYESMKRHGLEADTSAKALTHCLGGGVFDNFVEIRHLPIVNGFTDYLLCSDGVYEFCDEDTLEQALRNHDPDAVQKAVFAAGAGDNLSCVMISLQERT